MAISLYINDRFRNRKIDFFNEFQFDLAFNSVASNFSFKAYFDPYNIEHKEAFCVTHYHEVEIKDNEIAFLKGVITNQLFAESKTKPLINFGGYSLPGILEDVNIPPDIYPLQSDGLTLNQIAEKLIRPFKRNYGLEFIIDPAVSSRMNKQIKSTTASATDSIKGYLTTIAKQKNIILSHDEFGRLLFTEAKTKLEPIWNVDLRKGTPNGTSFQMSYDGQGMHSHITVQKQAGIDGGNAGESTIRNPYVIGTVYRPKVTSQTSGDDNDTHLAARRELGNELRGIQLTITLDSWMLNGKMIKPNNVISVFAPHLYLYNRQNWFIESVTFTGNSSEQTAVLNCVLPEVYNDEPVVSVFREINLHALNE